jgi:hypothetical protein
MWMNRFQTLLSNSTCAAKPWELDRAAAADTEVQLRSAGVEVMVALFNDEARDKPAALKPAHVAAAAAAGLKPVNVAAAAAVAASPWSRSPMFTPDEDLDAIDDQMSVSIGQSVGQSAGLSAVGLSASASAEEEDEEQENEEEEEEENEEKNEKGEEREEAMMYGGRVMMYVEAESKTPLPISKPEDDAGPLIEFAAAVNGRGGDVLQLGSSNGACGGGSGGGNFRAALAGSNLVSSNYPARMREARPHIPSIVSSAVGPFPAQQPAV